MSQPGSRASRPLVSPSSFRTDVKSIGQSAVSPSSTPSCIVWRTTIGIVYYDVGLISRKNIMKCVTKSNGTNIVGMYQVAPRFGAISIWRNALSRSTVPTMLNNQTNANDPAQFARKAMSANNARTPVAKSVFPGYTAPDDDGFYRLNDQMRKSLSKALRAKLKPATES